MAKIPTFGEQVPVPSARLDVRVGAAGALGGIAQGLLSVGQSVAEMEARQREAEERARIAAERLAEKARQAQLANDANAWELRTLADVNNAITEAQKAAPGQQATTFMGLTAGLEREIQAIPDPELRNAVLPHFRMSQERSRMHMTGSDARAISEQAQVGLNKLLDASIPMVTSGTQTDFALLLDAWGVSTRRPVEAGSLTPQQGDAIWRRGLEQLLLVRLNSVSPQEAGRILDSDLAQTMLSPATVAAARNNQETRAENKAREEERDALQADMENADTILQRTTALIGASIVEHGVTPANMDQMVAEAMANPHIGKTYKTKHALTARLLLQEAVVAGEGERPNKPLFLLLKKIINKTVKPEETPDPTIRDTLARAEAEMNRVLLLREKSDTAADVLFNGLATTGALPKEGARDDATINKVYTRMRNEGMEIAQAMDLFVRRGHELPTDAMRDLGDLFDEKSGKYDLAVGVDTLRAIGATNPRLADSVALDISPLAATAFQVAAGAEPGEATARLELLSDKSAPFAMEAANQLIAGVPDKEIAAWNPTDIFNAKNETDIEMLPLGLRGQMEHWTRYYMVEEMVGRGQADPEVAFKSAAAKAAKAMAGEYERITVRGVGISFLPVRQQMGFAPDEVLTEVQKADHLKAIESAMNNELTAWLYPKEPTFLETAVGIARTFVWTGPSRYGLQNPIPRPIAAVYHESKILIPGVLVNGTIARVLEYDFSTRVHRTMARKMPEKPGEEPEQEPEFVEAERRILAGRYAADSDPFANVRWYQSYGDISPTDKDPRISDFFHRLAGARFIENNGREANFSDEADRKAYQDSYGQFAKDYGWPRSKRPEEKK